MNGTGNFSPLSNNTHNQPGTGNKDNNPENKKIIDKQMASSSLFTFEHKNSVGTLFNMAR